MQIINTIVPRLPVGSRAHLFARPGETVA